MGHIFGLLCFTLLGGISALRHQVTSEIEPISNNNSPKYILKVSDLADSLTSPEWSIHFWSYLTITDNIVTMFGPDLSLGWIDRDLEFSGSSIILTEETVLGLWVRFLLGSTSTMKYAVCSIKRSSQYYLSNAFPEPLQPTSEIWVMNYCDVTLVDVVMYIDRPPITETVARAEILSTYLCSALGESTCTAFPTRVAPALLHRFSSPCDQ